MIEITKYKANDGSIFDNKAKCIKYDALELKVKSVLLALPSYEDDSCSFSNGEGYIQHNTLVKLDLSDAIVRLANDYIKPDKPFVQFDYYLGRYIDDANIKCLNRLSYKLQYIDDTGKEWGQPYFALNPGKGKDIQLN